MHTELRHSKGRINGLSISETCRPMEKMEISEGIEKDISSWNRVNHRYLRGFVLGVISEAKLKQISIPYNIILKVKHSHEIYKKFMPRSLVKKMYYKTDYIKCYRITDHTFY